MDKILVNKHPKKRKRGSKSSISYQTDKYTNSSQTTPAINPKILHENLTTTHSLNSNYKKYDNYYKSTFYKRKTQ